MSARTKPIDLMRQPVQKDCTSQPDSMPLSGTSPNAMSPHSPAPACPEGNLHAANRLGPAVKAKRDAQSKRGLVNGSIYEASEDGDA